MRLCGHTCDSHGSRADVFANLRLVRRAVPLDSGVLSTSCVALITDATRGVLWEHGGQAWQHSAERWATMLLAMRGHSTGVNPRGSAPAPLRARAWSSSSDHSVDLSRNGPQRSSRRCCVSFSADGVVDSSTTLPDAVAHSQVEQRLRPIGQAAVTTPRGVQYDWFLLRALQKHGRTKTGLHLSATCAPHCLATAPSGKSGKMTWQRLAKFWTTSLSGVLGETMHDCCGGWVGRGCWVLELAPLWIWRLRPLHPTTLANLFW